MLAHTLKETERERVNALVYIGDAMEEDVDALADKAGHLGLKGVPVFVFQEGTRAGRRAGLQGDRAPVERGMVPFSIRPRQPPLPACCRRWPSMRRAASRRSRRGAGLVTGF